MSQETKTDQSDEPATPPKKTPHDATYASIPNHADIDNAQSIEELKKQQKELSKVVTQLTEELIAERTKAAKTQYDNLRNQHLENLKNLNNPALLEKYKDEKDLSILDTAITVATLQTPTNDQQSSNPTPTPQNPIQLNAPPITDAKAPREHVHINNSKDSRSKKYKCACGALLDSYA